MSNMVWYVLLCVLALTLATVLTRAGYLLLGDKFPLPPLIQRALRYAPASALAAIIIPEIAPWTQQGGIQFDLKLVAAAIAIVVGIKSKSAMLTIFVGMAALWVLRWIF